MTYLCWTPVVTGAAFPRTVMEVAGLSARLRVRASDDRTLITDPDTGHTFVPGETSTDRTIYNAVALFCAIGLSIFLGKSLVVGTNLGTDALTYNIDEGDVLTLCARLPIKSPPK